jgi:SpoVK/Ycf46/Vps4 family AAA+-type ATPase
MNILLYGPPGSGKSCIINRVAQRTVEEGGLVLFNPSPRSLQKVFRVLDTLQPETRVLVIFEEIDQLIKDHGEGPFLHVLDGEVQKHNAMFIATTNYYDQVPNRIKRPGRFAVRSYVGYPSFIAREFYCFTKLKHAETAGRIAELTENFSIDQLKEVIRETYCMNKPLTQVIENLRTEFQIPTEAGEEQGNYVEDSSEDDDDDSDDEYEGN